MRILITNHSLRDLAGTELATFELARELKRLGHQVGVFSPFIGRMGLREAFQSKVPLFSLEDADEIRKFDPQVVHVQHWPNHLLLKNLGVDAPRLFHFHGPKAALETPPILIGETPSWIAVSDITFESVSNVSLWNPERGSRVLKWGNEDGVSVQNSKQSNPTRNEMKALVVSNHFPERYSEMLDFVSDQLGFTVTYVGKGHSVKPVTTEMILDADFVITLGRTAILAASAARPVLILDSQGLDGWLTNESYKRLEATGFSGMAFENRDFSREFLLETMSKMPSQEETEQLADLFLSNHSLKFIAKQIELNLQKVSSEIQTFEFERSSKAAVLYIEKLHDAEVYFRKTKFRIFKFIRHLTQSKFV